MKNRRVLSLALLSLGLWLSGAKTPASNAAEPSTKVDLIRVFNNSDQVPEDGRIGPPRRVTQGNDFVPPADRAAWQTRVRRLREQSLVASGLWPLPPRCPLGATITSVVDQGDYTVENLYFASHPGFYVAATVYRPKGTGPFPAVLCAHGHAKLGRLAGAVNIGRDGKPSTDPWPYQARGAGLARLGCIAMLYDMVGYADTLQVRHPTDSPQVRVPEGTDDFEGLEFEMHCLSTMGLQTWNSIRAVDYLVSRPDVDSRRIAISGASGGATQTLMLMMTDDRIAAAAPVCMVSTGFQGDCTCEQAALGKIGTDTVEFCAAFTPKPLIVVGATGDWTKEIIEHGGPEIRATYNLLGAGDRVEIVRFEAPHNYNLASREAVYGWLNRWLELGHPSPVRESPLNPLAPERLAVFTPAHPVPTDAVNPVSLTRYLIEVGREQLEDLRPDDAGSLAEFRRVVGTALSHLVATDLPSSEQVRAQLLGSVARAGVQAQRLLLSRVGGNEQVPAMLYLPAAPSGVGAVVVHPAGKAGLFGEDGAPGELLIGLLEHGVSVLAIDPFLTGEYHRGPQPTPAPDPHVGFFAAFNRTLLAQRVHDILTAVAYLRGRPEGKQIHLVGLQEAGPWVVLARGLCGERVHRTVAEINGASFRRVRDVTDPLYLPGALRYGDLSVLAALTAPGELWLSGLQRFDPSWVLGAFRAAGQNEPQERLRVEEQPATTEGLIAWLTRQNE